MSPDFTRRHVTRRLVPVFALAGLLLLASCSDGEPTAATTSGAGTPTAEAQTTSPDGTESGAPGTQQPTSPATPAETTSPEPGAESGAEPGVESGADNGASNDGEAAVAETGVEAARAWIEALGDGDLDAAFAVLGDASRQQAGGREGLESMASALAEGWGAFAYADPAYLPTSLGTVGGGEAGVVTVLATVQQEGTTERRALPLAYRIDPSGRAVVEPFVASQAPSSIDQPASGSTVACDVALTASVPTDATAVALGIDGQATLQPEIIPTDSEVDAATAELEDGLSAGEHVLTAAFVDADGRIGAATSIFTVEQGCA